jgi:hypothetical protein
VKSLPGSLSMEGVSGSGKPPPFNVAAVEAISIGRVESAPALRERMKRGR